jgi:GTP-binding protein
MLIDHVTIKVQAGAGGRGCVAFRREKSEPHGGPSGGDGGRGGSIILLADPSMQTLIDFQYRPEFKAHHGGHGMGSQCNGRDSDDIIVRVPLGTVVRDPAQGRTLADMTTAGQRLIAAKGGIGGRGNMHFTTSVAQTPRFAEPGVAGEERTLQLELRMLADVGLVGLPNAGKSLILTKVSAARPKVADYAFTTTEPNLGVVSLGLGESFVVADLPGLIEGAHTGVGLGHAFLRHIARTRIIVHVVDVGSEKTLAELKRDHDTILAELREHDPVLLERPRILAGNKTDMPGAEKRFASLAAYAKKKGAAISFPISALTGEGLPKLLRGMQKALKHAPLPPLATAGEAELVMRPRGSSRVKVMRDQDGRFIVRSRALERLVAGTDTDEKPELRKLQEEFTRMGVDAALIRAGVHKGDLILVGDYQFEYIP